MNPSPLLARVSPISGESLLSLVARAADANVFAGLSDLLGHAGITSHPAYAPFTAVERAPALASLLGTPEHEIASRMHPSVQADSGQVWWAGVRMDRRFIEARARRFSPAALERSPHHRLSWTNRALSFCPETFELLVSNCPSCGAVLGWTHTHGLTCCERCKASLLDVSTSLVSEALRAELKAATDLISSEPRVRDQVRSELKPMFADWDGGELFTAAIELGFAWSHPELEPGAEQARALREGRLSLVQPQDIAAGFGVLRDWPDGLEELLHRIKSARGSAPGSLRSLSTLGRFFDSRQPETKFRSLLMDYMAESALNVGVGLKLGHIQHKLARPLSDTLTLTEAQSVFGVTKKLLGRLVPEGESYLSGRLGRGGGVLLDASMMSRVAEAYHDRVSHALAADLLGVPSICIDAFCALGLVSPVTEPDALRLAGTDQLISRRSVQRIIEVMEALPATGEAGEPIGRVLALEFSPAAWSHAFNLLQSGEIALLEFSASARTLAERLKVSRSAVREALRGHRRRPPLAIEVTATDAARLLGVPEAHMVELIRGGYIRAGWLGRSWAIRVGELKRFSEEWAYSSQYTSEFTRHFKGGPTPNVLNLISRDFEPERTRHLTLLKRAALVDFTEADLRGWIS